MTNSNSFHNSLIDVLYKFAKASRRTLHDQVSQESLGGWEKFLANNNNFNIWRAINWREEYDVEDKSDFTSTDAKFKQFFFFFENTMSK